MRYDHIQAAQDAMRHRQVEGILWLRSNFASRLFTGGPAPIGLILNGVDGNTARIVAGLRGGGVEQLAGALRRPTGPAGHSACR